MEKFTKLNLASIVPSIIDFHYFTGDFTIKRHGSSIWDTVSQTNGGDGEGDDETSQESDNDDEKEGEVNTQQGETFA